MNYVMGITLAAGFFMFVGLIMITVWIMIVNAYTAYFKWRCRRSPLYFAKHVLKLPVTQWQATHLHRIHQAEKFQRLVQGYAAGRAK